MAGTPVGTTFNADLGTFVPNGNAEGNYQFRYFVADACGNIDSTDVVVFLSNSPCSEACPEPNIVLKTGSDVNPIIPILLCETAGFLSSEIIYEWQAYTLVSGTQTLITDDIGEVGKSYYIRDICLEREWLDLSNCAAEAPDKKIVYEVITTKIDGTCTRNDTIQVDLLKASLIDGIAYNLSPNPTVGELTLVVQSAETGNLSWDIADLTGRRVWSGSYDKATSDAVSYNLSIAHLPQGVYVAQIRMNNDVMLTQKITKF